MTSVPGMAEPATDATEGFFAQLASRGHERLLRKARGTVRFDLVDGKRVDSRHVTIERGDIVVSKRKAAADAIIRADRSVFQRLATGEQNVVATVLRGEAEVDGDWRLLVLVQRLFPASPGARGPRRRAGWSRRRRS
jgi:putative sterol carrier protein